MAVGVGDRHQVVLAVVGVLGRVAGRIGHCGQPVGIVVGVGRDLAVLVGDRGATPAVVVAEADGTAIGVLVPIRWLMMSYVNVVG